MDVYDSSTWGVLKLTLHAASYDWQFVPVAGSTFTDSGSQVVHGAPPTTTTNNGLDLGSGSGYVTFGDPAKLDLAQFTIETWFKRTGPGVSDTTGTGGITNFIPLVTHGSHETDAGSNVDEDWLLGIDDSTDVLAADFEEGALGLSPSLNHPVRGTTPISFNVWHHAAATYDGTFWRLYLDGNLEATLLVGQPTRSDSIQKVGLGAMIDSNGNAFGHFQGVLDEVRVWNVARSQAEIDGTINSELTGGSGLVARWGLNESAGSTVADSVAPAADGTITGSGTNHVPGAPLNIAVNHAPATPTLVAPTDGATGVSTAPTLSVGATDSDGDPLHVTFYGRAASGTTQDFTIVALPDTQYYSQTYPATFNAQTQWVVNQRATRNIVFVTHLGDVTNDGDTAGQEYQWTNADTAMSNLDGQVPYGIIPGNHDVIGGTAQFNTHFGPSRFAGQSWYGGHYGTGNLDSYQLIDASGMHFLMLDLEYAPTADELAWARGVLTANPGRRVILTTHDYLTTSGARDSVGDSIWNGLVNGNCSIFLVLSGHAPGSARSTATNSCGGTVNQVLQDYQSLPSGGNGYLRNFTFHPATDTIDVTTYSPTLGTYLTGADQFSLTYDMTGGSAYTQIGSTQDVTSGSTASVNWTNLNPDASYEWYATVSDGTATTTGPSWTFRTAAPLNRPPTVTVPADITHEATGPSGATVTFTATASDPEDGTLTPTCAPASGSTFALGATTVTCTATDSGQLVGSASFTVTVVDTTPPTITGTPADISRGTTNPAGAAVTYTPPTATDLVSGTIPVSCSPPSGSTFPVGTTTVTCTATDGASNQATTSFYVTVVLDQPPAAPVGLSASQTSVSVGLVWTANTESDLAGYNVYRSVNGGLWSKLNSTPLTTVTFTDTTAPLGTIDYHVTAIDRAGGESPASTTVTVDRKIALRSATTAQSSNGTALTITRPPGATTGDVLIAAVTFAGSVRVTAPSGWTQVRAETGTTGLAQAIFRKAVGASEPNSYQWTFNAKTSSSGVVLAYTGVDPTNPVDGSNGAAGGPSASLTAPSVMTQNDGDVVLGVFGAAAAVSIAPPAGMLEQAELGGGSGKTKLDLEISDQIATARGSTGAKTASASSSAAWIAQLVALRPNGSTTPTAPGTPNSLNATAGDRSVTLTWQAPADGGSPILGYRIYRSTASGSETFLVDVGNLTTYTDANLTNGTTYYYKVSARNSVGEGSLSSEASATPTVAATTPSAPRNLTASPGKPRGVALSWQAPSTNGGAPITNYLVYRGTSSGNETLLTTLGNVTSYKDTSATGGQTYWYYVTAKNSAGEGPRSAEVNAVAR
ncbi:MAG: fibronectin type III domain-containing protein [Gaiellaceae bacterium]